MTPILPLLLGCASIGSLQTAKTLDQGQFRAYLGVEVGYVRARPLNLGMSRSDLGFRWGITDDWELGGHVGGWLLGVYWGQLGLDIKRRLVRARSPREGWDVSIGLGLQLDGVWSGGATGASFGGQLPLLISKNLPNRSEIVMIPRLGLQHIRSRGANPVTKPLVGAVVGYAANPGRWTLMPFIGVWVSTNKADPVSQLVTWQGGFGVGYKFGPGASPDREDR